MSTHFVPEVPFVCLHQQLSNALNTLSVSDMKSVEHEDTEYNNDYSVDPLADPRLDKLDLFNLVDSEDRDKIMSAQASFDVLDPVVSSPDNPSNETQSVSGSGE